MNKKSIVKSANWTTISKTSIVDVSLTDGKHLSVYVSLRSFTKLAEEFLSKEPGDTKNMLMVLFYGRSEDSYWGLLRSGSTGGTVFEIRVFDLKQTEYKKLLNLIESKTSFCLPSMTDFGNMYMLSRRTVSGGLCEIWMPKSVLEESNSQQLELTKTN
jgi:hypothetical protein